MALPSATPLHATTPPNDIIILGTGDQMGIVTMIADSKAVQAASFQGINFNVYRHSSYPLTGSCHAKDNFSPSRQ
ncbi:DUF1308 domain-containing protein [Leptothermofonsia sichuanensis E412]|uniref:DUF1308 domain-containing protein n=1 Tax=Leptothermofonsia sichuanensis TaxID=2917832 RepID=UPI001CA646FC|nr:DUF1308 domain-containing protein [Leptothermofonsia sichuanensis]QZZ20447.1 DUF1308 domain-containing protein [Leptothermofonsia sichuanensis E412]